MRSLRGVAGVLGAGLIAACATTGSTLGSGVGDRTIERRPFYAGRVPSTASPRALGFLPVTYQRGASQPGITVALMEADGEAIRIGAEGVLARRTPMKVSAMGATALVAEARCVAFIPFSDDCRNT